MEMIVIRKLQPVHSDERGNIWDLINEEVCHVGVLNTKAGHIRGNHYFKKSKRYAYVLSGKFKIILAPAKNPKEKQEFILEKDYLIEIPPGIIHTFEALEDSVMIGMDTISRAEGGYENDIVREVIHQK